MECFIDVCKTVDVKWVLDLYVGDLYKDDKQLLGVGM